MVAVQCASATIVGAVLGGKNLDRVLERTLAAHGSLTGGEKSAVHSIAFDTLRHFGLLNAQLDRLLTKPVNDAPIQHLLLIGLAQLQFSKAVAHAIVDHAVNAAVELGFPRAKPLVNAVLRNYLREPEKFARSAFDNASARYDFPDWWIARTKNEYPAHWEAILVSAGQHPPMWLRANVRRNDGPAYVSRLAQAGLAVARQDGDAILLETPHRVSELPGFADGLVSVQDRGAQFAAQWLDTKSGHRVLDACAAPGGKAAHILEITDVELLALDLDEHRLRRVKETFTRLGLKAQVGHADAAKSKTWWDNKPFDRILLDAPCSGSGVVRRHPDIKWIRRESDVAKFALQQRKLLDSLWPCLSKGGRLLYATCSVFHAENDDVVDQFLRKTPGAQCIPLNASLMAALPSAARTATRFGHQLLPDQFQDGFYYALLEKSR